MIDVQPFLCFGDDDAPIKISKSLPRSNSQLAAPVSELPVAAGSTSVPKPQGPSVLTSPELPIPTKERSRAYRARQKDRGLSAVKVYLNPDVRAYLRCVSQVEGVTLSEAVSIALERLVRGEQTSPTGIARPILPEAGEIPRILLL